MRYVDENWNDMEPSLQDPELGLVRTECYWAEDHWEDAVRFVPYTDEQLKAIAVQKQRDRWLDEGQAEMDEALCAIYEMIIDLM